MLNAGRRNASHENFQGHYRESNPELPVLWRIGWINCSPLAQIVAEKVPGESTRCTIHFMNCRSDIDSKWIQICRVFNLELIQQTCGFVWRNYAICDMKYSNNFNAFKMHVLNSVQNSVIRYGNADSIPFSKAAGVAGIPGHIQVGCPYFCVHVTILFRYQKTRLSVLVPRNKYAYCVYMSISNIACCCCVCVCVSAGDCKSNGIEKSWISCANTCLTILVWGSVVWYCLCDSMIQ